MGDAAAKSRFNYRRWLPYWAVLRTDLRQASRNWVYRLWLTGTALAAAGTMVYYQGAHREAGLVASAADLTGNVLRGMLLGSVALVAVLAVGGIAGERGTLADSVLSRGISRRQYFLAKWHARLILVLGTAAGLATCSLLACHLLVEDALSLSGCLAALVVLMAMLFAVVSWGVAASALAGSTLLGVAVVWAALYGGGLLMSLLPAPAPSPERVLRLLPNILRGDYDPWQVFRLVLASLAASAGPVAAGMFGFARRDV